MSLGRRELVALRRRHHAGVLRFISACEEADNGPVILSWASHPRNIAYFTSQNVAGMWLKYGVGASDRAGTAREMRRLKIDVFLLIEAVDNPRRGGL
jgi:hypothetical protein